MDNGKGTVRAPVIGRATPRHAGTGHKIGNRQQVFKGAAENFLGGGFAFVME